MTIAALSFVKDDAKKIGAFIKDAGTVYSKRDDYLQMAGAISFFHAQEHGDPVFIQRFFDVLSKGHQNMFRVWLGKLSKVQVDEGFILWLGFKDDKFFVRAGTENVRKGIHKPKTLLADLWMKRAKPEVEEPTDVEKFNLMIALATKRVGSVTKLFEAENAAMPAALVEAIKDVEKVLVGLKKAG